jgi:adenosine kinase
MNFLVHGSIAFDLLLTHDGSFVDAIDPLALDQLSVSFLAQHFARHHGGTATNIAWNLALLGHRPSIVGAVGDDGRAYLQLLEERGIDTSFVRISDDRATATAIIATDNGARQITFFHPGADAESILPSFNGNTPDAGFAIVAPRNASLMIDGARQCKELGIPYLFDAGQR